MCEIGPCAAQQGVTTSSKDTTAVDFYSFNASSSVVFPLPSNGISRVLPSASLSFGDALEEITFLYLLI